MERHIWRNSVPVVDSEPNQSTDGTNAAPDESTTVSGNRSLSTLENFMADDRYQPIVVLERCNVSAEVSHTAREPDPADDVNRLSQELFSVMIGEDMVQELSQEMASVAISKMKGPARKPSRRRRLSRPSTHLNRSNVPTEQSVQGRRCSSMSTVLTTDSQASMDNLGKQMANSMQSQDINGIQPERLSHETRNTRTNSIYSPTSWIHGRFVYDVSERHSVGKMDQICKECGALMFRFEEAKSYKGEYLVCCERGNVPLHLLDFTYPEFLKELISNPDHPDYAHFHQNIRAYNSSVSFASMGIKVSNEDQRPTGEYMLKVHGQLYHGTYHARSSDGSAQYSQLYFLDASEANQKRLQHPANRQLRPRLLDELAEYIQRHNSFAQVYRMMKEKEEEYERRSQTAPIPNLRIEFRRNPLVHPGRGNVPTSDNIACVFDTSDGLPPTELDFVVYPKAPLDARGRENAYIPLQRLSGYEEPMTFALLYPDGGFGWTARIQSVKRTGRNKHITSLEYYKAKLFTRENVFNPILHGGKLLQQYILHAWLFSESNNLNFYRQNQMRFRIESYQGLSDFLENRATEMGATVGRKIVLPSTFQGGDRHNRELYYDSMEIVGAVGRPDFFITFTCNPHWQEVQENLYPGQTFSDRPDIVNRIFFAKLEEFKKDLIKNDAFGKVAGYVMSIEFQKRGLPHAHILLIMEKNFKITEAEDVDKFVCAELPDQENEPEMYEFVAKNMLHGPCGKNNPKSICMKDGKCSKGYPKEFSMETSLAGSGWPKYCRRQGPSVTTMYGGKPVVMDNRHVVPYNKHILQKYWCHVNVEICYSVTSIKYVNKYIFKGYDVTSLQIEEESSDGTRIHHDEINKYCEGRYIAAPEADWRLKKHPMHSQSHTVFRLGVHLPHQRQIFFEEGNVDAAFLRAQQTKSMFEGWFELNRHPIHGPQARQYLYKQIPLHYTWNAGSWKPRTPNPRWKVVPRLYQVSPRDRELFHLRLLTLHVPGATHWDDFYKVPGEDLPCNTFYDACVKRGLLETDDEWEKCLVEANNVCMPKRLRETFAFICVFNNPANAMELWEKFKTALSEDFLLEYPTDIAHNKALLDIEKTLWLHGMQNSGFGLPQTVDMETSIQQYNMQELAHQAEDMIQQFEPEQAEVKDAVMNAVQNPNPFGPTCIFVDGPGGTGKTYCLNAIIRLLRSLGYSVAVFASTGIAADLLDGGRTLHSGFRLPLDMHEGTRSGLSKTERLAQVLKAADLIIIDEATMVNVHALTAVSNALEYICDSPYLFGKKNIVLSGDWRQTLPVVQGASKKVVLENCITSSDTLWRLFTPYTLRTNRRATGHPDFCEWLLQIGQGNLMHGPEYDLPGHFLEIPTDYVIKEHQLMQEVYGDKIKSQDFDYLAEAIVITPLNVDSSHLNIQALQALDGPEKCYSSADRVDEESRATEYPVDFLNSLKPTGMPPHKLILKVGAIVMLTRNLQIQKGLLNGTRMMITNLSPNVIVCKIIKGHRKGKDVAIPRINMSSSDRLPFTLIRRQFPVELAYAMTINKSQGQSFSRVGVWLPRPVFSHGQLYVALSRTRDPRNLKICVGQRDNQGDLFGNGKIFTPNIVWPEIFSQFNRIVPPPQSPGQPGRRTKRQHQDTDGEDEDAIPSSRSRAEGPEENSWSSTLSSQPD